MEALSAERIRAGLGTTVVGREIHYRAEIGSTNDEARRLAREGAPEGTLVVAEYQTAGRGRLDRRWEAPPGSSLLLSLVFRPALAAQQVGCLTMICGLAASEAIEAQTGLAAGLKWPNDVLVGGGKVGGLLAEVELQGAKVAHAVIGVGLNVNQPLDELPGGSPVAATSLAQVLGREVARLPLLQAVLRAIERRYLALQAGESPQAEWTARLLTLGQAVVVSGGGRRLEGVAEGVNADGALLVRLSGGRLETVLAGDVTLRGPA